MSPIVRVVAVAALMLAGASAPAMAQNANLNANYGNLTLRTGFTPDPQIVNVTSGGNIDVSQNVNNCVGMISAAPDVQLTFAAGSLPLAISVNSGADTTLVINGPDGRWYCDDDSGGGVNPSLVFQNPGSGVYDIWVGAYGGSSAAAQLSISELSTY